MPFLIPFILWVAHELFNRLVAFLEEFVIFTFFHIPEKEKSSYSPNIIAEHVHNWPAFRFSEFHLIT